MKYEQGSMTVAGIVSTATMVSCDDGGGAVSKLPQVVDKTVTEILPSDLEGATSIDEQSFKNCSGLTSVVIPNSVTSIGIGAFDECRNLTSIVIGSGVTTIGQNAFYNCRGLTSITIPDSVTNIDNYAFYYCYKLTSVVIGNSVMNIGIYAFASCSKLTSITMKRLTPPTIQSSTFNSVPSNATIIVPKGSLNAYKTATNWSTRANYIVEADE